VCGDTGRRDPTDRASRPFGIAVTALLVASALVTWWRLSLGADLVNEAFSVLVPWRWALGDRPFVDEQNLSQSAGMLLYPFDKLYALLGGNDSTGLVLYDRHLYLGLGLLTAFCVFLLVRRELPRVLAVLVAAPFATIVLFETPQVTANTLCALLLSCGAALVAVSVLGGPRVFALLAGVAVGLACIAYPTVLLLTPFCAVLIAFSVRDWLGPFFPEVEMTSRPSVSQSPPSGLRAWRVVSVWALGGFGVVVPVVAGVVAIAGPANLRRCWDYTISLARQLDQLGGTSKASEIFLAFVTLLVEQWYVVLAALLALVILRVRPRVGRWLLLLTAPAVWVTGATSQSGVAGAVILYALAAPYLYVFLPYERRRDGARLLSCVWAPAVVIGAMTAYTSADGFVRAAVGLLSGLVVSGLFLAWGLEPLRRHRGGLAWAAVALAGIVVVTLAFQVQFQVGGVRLSRLDMRMTDGPWKGIALTGPQGRLLSSISDDLSRATRQGDRLLAYPQATAFYLCWPGKIAANTYQLYVAGPSSPLPAATLSDYRRRREIPTVVAHVVRTSGTTPEELRHESGGLGYPPVEVSPRYVIERKPPGESVEDVLARLPRP